MRSGPGIGPIRMEKEVAVDDLGERSGDPLPTDSKPEPAAHSRREFLKKAAGVAVGLPVAGALAGNAAAAPRISLTSRAKPLRRRHAPVREGPVRQRREGRDREAAEAVRGQDRRQGRAHGRPVERRGRDVRDELRRAEPVRRQLPDEHRPDGPRHQGRARGAEHEAVAQLAGLRVDGGEVHPEHDQEEHLPGQALRPAVHHRRHGHLLQQGPAREGRRRQHPAHRDRAGRRSAEGAEARRRRLGPQRPAARTRTSPGTSSTTASTTAASTSSRRTSRRSPSACRRRPSALQFYADLVNKWKVQPPVGQYDREAGVSLFKAGRIGFLHDEPLRLPVFRSAKLPFKWDFVNPMGAAGSGRSSRPPGTG